MARYYYDKHNISTSYTYSNRRYLGGGGTAYVYKSSIVNVTYSFGSTTGFYGTSAMTMEQAINAWGHALFVSDQTVYDTETTTLDGDYYDCSTYGVEECDKTANYSKGAYITSVVAEDGTYPANGIQGGYWWVRGALAFPAMKVRVGGAVKTSENGWVRVGGALKAIEKIWVRVGGAVKEVI